MCGIVAATYRDSSPDPAWIRAMTDRIAHRGPDGEGVRVFPHAALGHRRLSIIDLTDAAAQPMHRDGVTIAFNGEVYNFRELRAELEARGHTFRSTGDTEVVLRAWFEWGTDVVARLDGMFAFALWDERREVMLVARDRTGKKPLFIYEDEHKTLIASEIKSILAHPDVDRTHSREALPQFLSHGYVPTPGTFYARIRKLPPATWELLSRSGSGGPRRYWDFPVERARLVGSAEAMAEVRRLFLRAVERRMVADVPLGAFLSGGVDSSLVVGAMATLSNRPVKTFSIGFEGQPAWDETGYAQIVAKRFNTEHTEFKVRPESFELLEKIAWHFDEPFGDSSAIPTFIVSSLTRQHVKVALTGDGGDEVFAGYPRFIGGVAMEYLPSPVRQVLGVVGRALPRSDVHEAPLSRIGRLAQQAARPLDARMRGWLTIFDEAELRQLLRRELAPASMDSIAEPYHRALQLAARTGTLNRVLYLNAKTYLLDDLNVKQDRASMAASLETRSPFLDTELMEYAFRLPGWLRLRGRTTKWILKKAFADLLPREIVERPKMGFGMPLRAWFKDELRELLRDRLLGAGARNLELLERSAVESILQEHEAGRRDRSYQLWCLLMLELWLAREAAA